MNGTISKGLIQTQIAVSIRVGTFFCISNIGWAVVVCWMLIDFSYENSAPGGTISYLVFMLLAITVFGIAPYRYERYRSKKFLASLLEAENR